MNNIKGLSESKRAEIVELAEKIYHIGFADGQASTAGEAGKPLTIKRVAKVGEKIFITNSSWTRDEYANGDILYVTEVHLSGVSANGIEVGITHDEYEVIAESASPPQNIKSANQQRAELIQRAREFVDNLIDEIYGYYRIIAKSGEKYLCDAVFKHNHMKRTTTCILVGASTGYTRKKAVVHCHPNEVFNEPIGEVISLCKALQIDIPQEFLVAVQPTHYAVGQIVTFPKSDVGHMKKTYRVDTISSSDSELTMLFGNGSKAHAGDLTGSQFDKSEQYNTLPIIDDTNAEYEFESVGETV